MLPHDQATAEADANRSLSALAEKLAQAPGHTAAFDPCGTWAQARPYVAAAVRDLNFLATFVPLAATYSTVVQGLEDILAKVCPAPSA